MRNIKSTRLGVSIESDHRSFYGAAKTVLSKHEEESFCFLDESKLKKRVPLIKEHFLPEDHFQGTRKVIYAIKANPLPRILQILNEAGIDGFDCASLNEINHVQGLTTDKPIYFNNPIKTQKEIRAALMEGVSSFTVQSRHEIEKILSQSHHASDTPVEISVRMATDNPSAAINLSDKYGISEDTTLELLKSVEPDDRVQRSGISIHTGSQNTNFSSYDRAVEAICAVARAAGGVHSLNLGGGIPVQPFSGNHAREIAKYVRYISEVVRRNVHGALVSDESRIILELGRSIIADSVDLVIPILSSEKRRGEDCLYIGDGLFTSFIDDAIHGWQYPLLPFPRLDNRPYDTKSVPYNIFGRTCDSGDRLQSRYTLPADIQEGDYLHIPCAGAYMDSQATHFNGFQPPKYVSYNLI